MSENGAKTPKMATLVPALRASLNWTRFRSSPEMKRRSRMPISARKDMVGSSLPMAMVGGATSVSMPRRMPAVMAPRTGESLIRLKPSARRWEKIRIAPAHRSSLSMLGQRRIMSS